ncbi:SDR family oxidoreductase [Pinibacter aurantiacus]|uniref:SDR family oxidoreductase n=1 Tax=Pinibacter aurantiacus TaxID=2851599 RepID=A0A9E2SF00_9BACT|nr:SDR family oxidoreductase [Pinibacter aurantiacus]MBV4360382.1 SDR family oxidoreductase [Pinibacter aurantiacus]
MKSAFITGANRGIGFETAKQLAALGYFVYIGSREKTKGLEAVAELKALGFSNADYIELDVTSIASIKAARQTVEGKTPQLDVLINNAGISGGFPQQPLAVPIEKVKTVFETNFFAPIQVIQEFIGLLKKSNEPRIVNVTTELSSITKHQDPSWEFYGYNPSAYGASKSALNAYTVMLAKELKDTNFKVNCVCPGFTKTAFNNYMGVRPVEQGARAIVKYATLNSDGATGKFFNEEGEMPW